MNAAMASEIARLESMRTPKYTLAG
jgi:hypothetical protein